MYDLWKDNEGGFQILPSGGYAVGIDSRGTAHGTTIYVGDLHDDGESRTIQMDRGHLVKERISMTEALLIVKDFTQQRNKF